MKRFQKAKNWFFAAVAVVFVLLAASTYFTYAAFSQLQVDRAQFLKDSLVLQTLRQLFSELQDAETGHLGYLLAQDSAYLDPYLASLDKVQPLLLKLQTLAEDRSAVLRNLAALQGAIDARLYEIRYSLEIAKTQGFEAARQRILTDVGKRAMDRIRAEIDNLIEQMDREVLYNRAIVNSSVDRARLAALLAAALGLLVAIVGGIALGRNFNRLRNAQEELREQASLLQTTLDNTREGVAAFDPVKGLLTWNPRFFSFAGYPDDFPRVGRQFGEFLEFDRSRSDRMFDLGAEDAGMAGLAQMSKLKQRLRIGGRELECSHKRTQTGSIVMTCSDITERLQTEQVARQAQKMEAIGHLTGGIAHDFNNLLQVIASSLDLMARHKDNPAQLAANIEHASIAAGRGAQLTRQLLAFARRQPLEPVVINLGRRVRAMGDLLHRTLGETIEIETIVDAGLWNTFVDVNQVENAILNLSVNARDSMPGGGKLTIELANAVLDEDYARRHDEVTPGQYVMLAVTDTGFGMPADVAARAFEPFFTTKPEGKGTGLGLSMVYGFVKQSSGHAKIYSEVGHGTTIKVYLPRSRRPEEAVAMSDDAPGAGGNERILLVEDDEDVRRAVSEMTRSLGYQVLEAKDGEQALEMLQNGTKVDLLFTDVVMSGAVSGRVLANRAQELLPSLAVLFTSGYTENAIIHHGRLDEGVHLLSKPYREPELSQKLRTVLEEKRHADRQRDGSGKEGSIVNGFSILLVDDDSLIRMSTAGMLQDLGHSVQEAACGGDALALLAENPSINMLIVDIALPDMNGVALVTEASKKRAGLRVIFASGHSPKAVDLDPQKVRFVFLAKPYNTRQLADALARLS
ncbi:MAG: response regulator [Dongiaceae bacterium]